MDIQAERAYETPFANVTLLPMLLLSLAQQKHSPKTAEVVSTEYDYVIVGAGSAGSVVAGRLSEMPCVTVLLLEAGKPPPLLTEVPGLARFFWFSDIDWQYRTAPQRYTGEGLINRQVVWPSGKTLGGTSVLNGMLNVRGNRRNYDDWAAQGAKGWSYEEVLPYFKKLEDNRDPEYVANGFHGVGGPQTIHRPRYRSEMKDPIFEAAKLFGYKVVDPNGARQTGFYDLQSTMRAGQRCSTAKAYLVPAENRTNLHILPNAFVRKVLFKKRRATGVEFDFQGKTYQVKAKREVIMSAGTTNTAQLLMLSGIGPKKELERFKIPMVADLPVGKNLQDHCGSNVNFLLDPKIQPLLGKITNPKNIAQYIQNRTGPLASSEFISVLAFLKNRAIVPKKDRPDHQLYFAEVQEIIALQLGITPQVFAQVYAPFAGRAAYTCVSQILHPKSRGTVTLHSTDPYDPPVIDPNYFEDPQDMQDMIEGLKVCMRIGTSPPLRKVLSLPGPPNIPGCEKYAGDEDMYFWCQARSIVFTLNHQVGTAKMGDPNDPTTVVDPQLRVKKVEGLRVVDASVIPIVTSGNTNIPVIMVAEKASDMIKETIECHDHNHNHDHHHSHHEHHKEPQHSTWSDSNSHSDASGISHDSPPPQDIPFNKDSPLSEWSGLPSHKWEGLKDKWQDKVPETIPWNKEVSSVIPWNMEVPPSVISTDALNEDGISPGVSSAINHHGGNIHMPGNIPLLNVKPQIAGVSLRRQAKSPVVDGKQSAVPIVQNQQESSLLIGTQQETTQNQQTSGVQQSFQGVSENQEGLLASDGIQEVLPTLTRNQQSTQQSLLISGNVEGAKSVMNTDTIDPQDVTEMTRKFCSSLMSFMNCQMSGNCNKNQDFPMFMFGSLCSNV